MNTKHIKKNPRVDKGMHHHLKMAVVPHAKNRYRPHLIRWYGLAAIAVLVIGLQAGYNLAKHGTVLGLQADITTTQLLNTTNRERTSRNIGELKLNVQLSEAAHLKAQDMFASQYWSHVAPNGTTPWHWVDEAGYKYSFAGENLAKNFASTEATNTAWMASPEHRKNMLDERYSDVGFAVMTGQLNGKTAQLVVALYGAPSSAVAGMSQTVAASSQQPVRLLTKLSVAFQSLTPAAMISLVLLLVTGAVALGAQLYRHKLPKRQQKIWYQHHHGLIKTSGMISVSLFVLLIYSGGQI